MERRVVITAASAITPVGRTEAEIVDNLTAGRSGVRSLREDSLLAGLLNSRVYGTVAYDIAYDFPRKYAKTMGPVAFYACQVAREVIEEAGLDAEFRASGRMGVAFGSTQGSPTIQRDVMRALFTQDRAAIIRVNAAAYLQSMTHTAAANIARMFSITGRTIASCTACTTSSQSIGFGYEAIKFGVADAMLCGGADEYDTTTVAVFDQLLVASHAFNATPERTPRPFDRRRDGLVIGEGAGAVMLEEYEFARRRGAEAIGEVIGFANCNNGGDMIMPSSAGIELTLRTGLAAAKLVPSDVDLVSAHATATKFGDVVEAQAMRAVYGDQPWVTGLKSYVGHTMGTCGVMEAIFCLYMMKRGILIPTLNLEEVDPDCAMVRHVREVRDTPVNTVAVQNFAFGGVNTVLFVRRV
ncbi:MAG: beta-ketoacyl-ACP synthase [Polyangiaceae bacterium]|nr:beta-ketoacyl-ACP synthase [Polyangiaceae bacterium]